MRANFKDTQTGEHYHVQSYKMRFIDGKMAYFTNGEQLISENGSSFEYLGGNSGIEADHVIMGEEKVGLTESQRHRNVKHFKERAKAHANSEEGRHMKKEATERELKSMGLRLKQDK